MSGPPQFCRDISEVLQVPGQVALEPRQRRLLELRRSTLGVEMHKLQRVCGTTLRRARSALTQRAVRSLPRRGDGEIMAVDVDCGAGDGSAAKPSEEPSCAKGSTRQPAPR